MNNSKLNEEAPLRKERGLTQTGNTHLDRGTNEKVEKKVGRGRMMETQSIQCAGS